MQQAKADRGVLNAEQDASAFTDSELSALIELLQLLARWDQEASREQ